MTTVAKVLAFGEFDKNFWDSLKDREDLIVEMGKLSALTQGLNFGPDVILYQSDNLADLTKLERIFAALKKPILVLGDRSKLTSFDDALAVGVADIVSEKENADYVAFALRKLHMLKPSANQFKRPGHTKARAQRLAIFGPKGGVGTTSIATSLAAKYAEAGLDTLIIDLDLQFGDVAIGLGVKPNETLLDFLMNTGGDLDTDKVRGCVLPSNFSEHLGVMPAPLRPEDSEMVKEDRFKAIVNAIQYVYDVIIFDMPSSFNGIALAALECSDKVLTVTSPEVASIRSLAASAETLNKLQFSFEKYTVMNKSKNGQALLPDGLGLTLDFVLPQDASVEHASEQGRPASIRYPKSDWSQKLSIIAEALVPDSNVQSTARSRTSLLSRFGKRSHDTDDAIDLPKTLVVEFIPQEEEPEPIAVAAPKKATKKPAAKKPRAKKTVKSED